ncbi:HAD-IC family P-type ATPase [Algoriphagus sp. Y33]|uniref:cation-translocating P-type ATPase n=1 Tax=Algoriphagus sp. Y33 TaxID=2772483 RepID=UPI001785323B|nr:HAD-IC family P-type ATPase [Algoriphagus sp. Y33]
MPSYHHLTVQETLDTLQTSKAGLSSIEVTKRRTRYGWNELPVAKQRSWVLLFFRQFKSLMVGILFAAAFISFLTGHTLDVYVILAVLLINALIGFIQEYRAEKSVESLKKMLVQQAFVIRDGQKTGVDARDLVPGDIIVSSEGEVIPADARVLEANNLRVNEAPLTGESTPIGKHDVAVSDETLLADQKNMLWKGTYVSGGQTVAVVCHTGLQTAIGDIAQTLSAIKPEKTNFQLKSDRLAKQMGMMAIGSTILFFIVGYFGKSLEVEELLLVSIAVMVSAIPEGLPAVLSIVLAIGSNRMSKQHAIVKDFASVETLGSVTTIITDKTGTLTQNTLTVRKIMVMGEGEFEISGEGWLPAGNFYQNHVIVNPLEFPILKRMLQVSANSNNAEISFGEQKDGLVPIGDPTEAALLVMAKKAGIEKDFKRYGDLPFDSQLKMRASLCRGMSGKELFVVGAPEKLLEKSGFIMSRNGPEEINDQVKAKIKGKIDQWSQDAMRVIGIAFKTVRDSSIDAIDENELDKLVWLGIVGMIDPPRPEVKPAIEKCHRAGIRVIMATGDHINTAVSIAKKTGIIGAHQEETELLALTEQQLLRLEEAEFDEVIKRVNVFSRLTPRMKLRIAERLQQMGELVAMTGDGVNDAPALKKADIGIAMGIMGTDVTRDAANLVLADDNFATIVRAVEVGRVVFTNARQASFFLVTTNLAEIATLICMIILGYPVPLTAIQILWLNLVTDGVGDVALATEQGHGDELDKKPIGRKEGLLNREILPFLIIMPVLMAMLCIVVYLWFYDEGVAKTRTAVFITMASTQLYNLFNMRSLKKSVFEIGIFSNKYVTGAFVVSLAIVILITEVPFFQTIFLFEPLSFAEFLILVSISSLVLWIGEAYKLVSHKMPLKSIPSLT